jgi:hypothetical protein
MGPVTIRLQPCGSAHLRLVDRAGKPIPERASNPTRPSLVNFTLIVSPGPSRNSQNVKVGQLFANECTPAAFDPIHYAARRNPDAQGRLEFPALIPGATYRIKDNTIREGRPLRREFTVKPGEDLDLSDILIEKP